MKKVLLLALVLLSLVWFYPAQAAAEAKVYFFNGDGCPHCAKEESFLEYLASNDKQLQIYSFEIWKNSSNADLLKKVGEALNADVSGVPVTVVGDKYLIGYLDADTTGKQIVNLINQCRERDCPDIVGQIIRNDFSSQENNNNNQPEQSSDEPVLPDQSSESSEEQNENQENFLPESISLPLLGKISLKNLSLPALTVLLGVLDGFNPCAMWVLIFLIGLLLGMENRKRMWILGTTFIIASSAVYFLFMSAWLNLLLFVGLLVWVRVIIGLVALITGGLNLKEYFKNKEAACKVTGHQDRKKIFEKLKKITQSNKFIMALGGIILLAFAVNLVELLCSAGLPAVYTQILALNNLPTLGYYGYILLYIFFFMIDDLIVFIVAMVTLKAVGLTNKYGRLSNLIGGIVMLIIGLLMLLKPEWLMFG